ncbi:hypothetical protein EV11_0793 [Prochlorococcus sp. SS52]|uniref:4-hydroxythreonine-4-phosphate dehydrogenase n=1 Tax=Prochlorococcus marinus TaxID=1219 RepID=UPI0002DE0B5B|nr:hypothetical protein EV04_0956 [Prochlorococcus marinus str. LG]KGG22323.1 hypothetical protein EV08_0140 [Prochlorococcus marinus str. SS2]KGG22660.1 hypothetical protein EV09_1398 [Prochlorococcus marinus str. SS35]KGG32919.1 hypothetical protein EV10_0900 [Prochlorococcus marinus str. SS51]KGG36615.1 hypothetical protein EV11_0793 [Prochlorococcus sp. SS52]
MVYGIAQGMRDGWLVVKWSQLLHNIGFTQVDPNKPMNWSEFIINRLENDSSKDSDE